MKKESNRLIYLVTVKRIIAIGLVALLLFSLTACNGQHKMHEDGYFQYIVVGQDSRFPQNKADEVVAIIGFTGLGKEQEVIDFPRVIKGRAVRYIGYGPIRSLGMSGEYHLESPNLKKVYIHDNIISIYDETFIRVDRLSIMMCAARNYLISADLLSSHNLYTYKSIYDTLDESKSFWLEDKQAYTLTKKNTNSANIVFLNNYSDEVNGGYYRLDNIETDTKIPRPPAPERQGYEFSGWYTEAECTNLWDFDTASSIAENEEFKLYAGWNTK